MYWTVTLKVIGPFDRDVKLNCYKLKYIKGKGIIVSGSSVPFYEEYDGDDIFIPVKDIYKIETEVWSEWGIKRETFCFDNSWKDEENRMFDRMKKARELL